MKINRQSGFTLIEAVIYLALFSLLFSGVIICAYSILESSGRNQAKALMQGDGNFIAAKINWALAQAVRISVPAEGDLQIATSTGATEFMEFKMGTATPDLLLSRNGGAGVALNNSNEKVSNLFFIKLDASGNRPEGVNYGFTLNSLAPNGAPISIVFASSAVYLRK